MYFLTSNIIFSLSFYKRFADRLDWCYISEYHKLSESVIEKCVDRMDWERISKFQDLSDAFIDKYRIKIIKKLLVRNRLIIRRKFLDELCWFLRVCHVCCGGCVCG